MSYQITISGHVDSAKTEGIALKKAADLAEELEANGVFSFSGTFFSVFASAPADAIAKAHTALAEYNARTRRRGRGGMSTRGAPPVLPGNLPRTAPAGAAETPTPASPR